MIVLTILGADNDEQRAVEDFRRRLISAEMNAVAEIMAMCFAFLPHAHSGNPLPPYSFTMKMVVLFIPFLRDNIKIGKTEPKQLSDFRPIWKDYCTKVLGADRIRTSSHQADI
jgi:hypothetical protein